MSAKRAGTGVKGGPHQLPSVSDTANNRTRKGQAGSRALRNSSSPKEANAKRRSCREEVALEAVLFGVLLAYLVVQNCNIYRSALLNVNMTATLFILLGLFRRIVVVILKRHSKGSNRRGVAAPNGSSSKKVSLSQIRRNNAPRPCLTDLLLVTAMAGGAVYLAVRLLMTLPFRSHVFIFYPPVAYMLALFTPFSQSKSEFLNPRQPLSPSARTTITKRSSNINKESKESAPGGALIPGGEAGALWAEQLRQKPNERVKTVVYEGVLYAYIVGLLPLKVIEEHYYYDPATCGLLVGLVFCSSVVILILKELRVNREELNEWAQGLGSWTEQPRCSKIGQESEVPLWSPKGAPYAEGALVQHRGRVFMAETQVVAGEPGSLSTHCLQKLFKGVPVLHDSLLGVQSCILVLQMALMISSRWWKSHAAIFVINYSIAVLCLLERRHFRASSMSTDSVTLCSS